MSDLSVIYPEAVMTNVGGTPVAIRPVKLRHFEEFGEAAGGLIRVAASGDQAEIYAYAKQAKVVKAILKRSTSISWWSLWFLPAATAVELMLQVVAVNSAFFGQALVQSGSLLAGASLSND